MICPFLYSFQKNTQILNTKTIYWFINPGILTLMVIKLYIMSKRMNNNNNNLLEKTKRLIKCERIEFQ